MFRFTDGKYLLRGPGPMPCEGNFRCTPTTAAAVNWRAPVSSPGARQWHLLRVVAVGDHIQGWLDGAMLFDHRAARFKAGSSRLRTKGDSITAFRRPCIHGMTASAWRLRSR